MPHQLTNHRPTTIHHQGLQQQQQQQQQQQLNHHPFTSHVTSTTSHHHLQQHQHQEPHHQFHQTLHHQLHHPSNSHLSGSSYHLQQQQHQQQQQQQQELLKQQQQHMHTNNHSQQQYNMNSDYSSSTYHIYDQISDLIIIKQQRMERKRQLEQRRKVILIALAATLLVSTISFLLYQAFFAGGPSSAATTASASFSSQSQFVDNQFESRHQLNDAPTHHQLIPMMSWPSPVLQHHQQQQVLSWPAAAPNQQQQQQPGHQFVNWPPHLTPVHPINRHNPNHAVLLPAPSATNEQQQQQQLQLCSGHGTVIQASDLILVNGAPPPLLQCRCDPGYLGERCQLSASASVTAASGAAYESTYALTSVQVKCMELTNCSGHGSCNSHGRCQCYTGFFGLHCESRVHHPGFYGKHYSLGGCPNQCSQRGQCVKVHSTSGEHHQQQQQQVAEWRCQCQPGSTGDDCGILLERQCDDGLDNDHDGLVDCADSECCSDKVCQNSTLCMKSPDPLDILMRKQPPPPTSSFFQRMQFLIEKYSSQTYSSSKDFNDSAVLRYLDRASVVRGRVTFMKQGVTGVRVSVAGQTNIGMTLTRDNGYFDLLVNGGGAVSIEFRREPFATKQKIVRVPWNEIVLIDQIELKLEATADPLGQPPSASPSPIHSESDESPTCFAHNYKLMKPRILSQPKSTRKSSLATSDLAQSRAVILKESGMVQHSIPLPGSSGSQDLFAAGNHSSPPVSLIYTSSRANEFMSTISIQLTPPADTQDVKLPQELKAIHLRIVIEGNLFEQVFEPQMNLSYTYAWNRRNVYRQKSFGLSTASVSVGYEYFDCKQVVWNTNHLQLAGHDLSISDIGNQWNLNIHHRYNYRDSILQRGDGVNFNLKTDKQWVVQQVFGGDGQPRQAELCAHCDTGAADQRLQKPQALVSAPDGSLYVADFNLIKRIEWNPGTGGGSNKQHSTSTLPQPAIKTILELPTSRVPSKYSLALNLADQRLYMGDIDRHQIYLIREQQQQQPTDLNETTGTPLYPSEESLLPVVGDGIRCQLEDRSNCGDGQPARLASLIAPRAIAFDLAGKMYIADGPNVRMVNTDGKIYTILGDYGSSRHTKFSCSGDAVPMHKFVPKSPQDLAFNPIDETLFILDNNVVYKVTQDKRVQVVAGRLAHCEYNNNNNNNSSQKFKATEVQIQSAQSITFSQNGELFITEDDQNLQISRVLLVKPEEESISLFAGVPVEQVGASRSVPTVDLVHHLEQLESSGDNILNEKQRVSNSLQVSSKQATRATDYRFGSISAIAVDQQGRLLVVDKTQLKILSVEPDLPQINSAGEYELQSPDNLDELLVFNRFGHHLATRDTSRTGVQRNSNKYTFSYTVNTSFGLLGSISYASGNKISIYRDGPHHAVRMIETAFRGQCKLDISRTGQVLSISTTAPDMTKTSLSYHNDGGLLKQSKDSASGELFDFSYDEFGRATRIKHTSPKLRV